MKRDTEFRKWYDAREGTKSESFAYDVWCAAWAAKPWVGLTEEELKEIQFSSDTEVEYVMYDEGEYGVDVDILPENFARAIEAKLKEKNHD